MKRAMTVVTCSTTLLLGSSAAEAAPAPNESRSDEGGTGRASAPVAPAAEADTKAAGPSEAAPPTKRFCADVCGYEELFQRSTVGFGVSMGVSHLFEINGINRRLERVGFEGLPEYGPHVAFSIPISIERFLFLTQIRFMRFGAPGDPSKLDTYLGTFSFGYSLTPPEVLALYPFAGLGVGAAELTVGTPGPAGLTFDQALTQSRGALDLSTIAFVGTVGFAADLLLARTMDHPTRGLFIGLRTGFSAGFAHSDWSLGPQEGDVLDGPAAPMSGLYGEGAFGLRF